MAITGLKTWTTSDLVNATNLNADKSVIEAKFNGGIVNADVSSNAAIATSKLDNKLYEFTVQLKASAAGWAAAAVGEPLAFAALPGTSAADGTYTGIAYAWVCTDCGSQSGLFRVEWGYYDSAGTWTVVSTPIDNVTLTANSGVNDTAGAGGATFSTAFTLASDFTAANQGPRFLALVMDTDDANAITAEPDFLEVHFFVPIARTSILVLPFWKTRSGGTVRMG